MTTAKEIIATTCIEGRTEPVGPLHAQAILAALAAAGFRIVGPGEVDPVTVEKCAEVAEQQVEMDNPAEYNQGLFDAAAAIRALAKEK